MNNNAIISATGLHKSFGTLQVVNNVNFTVQKGEFVSIVGKSGSGKTTLLSLLSGLEHPSSGQVVINEKNITELSENKLALFRRQFIGFVFQSFHLIPTLSAWENVALPLFPEKIDGNHLKQKAVELLGQMEMGPRSEHRISELSGGEKQRVAIARALVNDPEIVFADEPTGNLDSATGTVIMRVLKELHLKRGLSLLMVTHDMDLAKLSDRIVQMKDGEVIR